MTKTTHLSDEPLIIYQLFVFSMFPEKTRFWGRRKNASTLLSSTCVFKYLKIMKIIHIQERPARRLDDTEYQLLTELV